MIPRRTAPALAVALAIMLTGCGQAEGVPEARRAKEVAAESATRALARVAQLENMVEELLGERSADRADALRRARKHRAAITKLEASLTRLKEAIGAAQASAASATEQAAAAAATVLESTRALSVLTNRFDYHLRHGGP